MDLKDEILILLKRAGAPSTMNISDMVEELVDLVDEEIAEAEEERSLQDEDDD